MKLTKSLLLYTLISATLIGCGKKLTGEDVASVDEDAATVESGMTAMQGVADDQAGSSFAMTPAHDYRSIVANLLLPKAQAASCLRALHESCVSGVRASNYGDCDGARNGSLEGDVTLTYSNASCSMATDGDSVTRTYDVTISGPRGGVLKNSSELHTTYDGSTISGGGKLTKVSGGWQIDILGRHKELSFRDKELFDISVKTTTPISITGSLARAGRTVHGGTIEIYHNLAGFTAAITPSNLVYSGTCCHPVSGSLNVTYSGSRTGTATVTFNGCGEGTLTKDGSTKTLELTYCE